MARRKICRLVCFLLIFHRSRENYLIGIQFLQDEISQLHGKAKIHAENFYFVILFEIAVEFG